MSRPARRSPRRARASEGGPWAIGSPAGAAQQLTFAALGPSGSVPTGAASPSPSPTAAPTAAPAAAPTAAQDAERLARLRAVDPAFPPADWPALLAWAMALVVADRGAVAPGLRRDVATDLRWLAQRGAVPATPAVVEPLLAAAGDPARRPPLAPLSLELLLALPALDADTLTRVARCLAADDTAVADRRAALLAAVARHPGASGPVWRAVLRAWRRVEDRAEQVLAALGPACTHHPDGPGIRRRLFLLGQRALGPVDAGPADWLDALVASTTGAEFRTLWRALLRRQPDRALALLDLVPADRRRALTRDDLRPALAGRARATRQRAVAVVHRVGCAAATGSLPPDVAWCRQAWVHGRRRAEIFPGLLR